MDAACTGCRHHQRACTGYPMAEEGLARLDSAANTPVCIRERGILDHIERRLLELGVVDAAGRGGWRKPRRSIPASSRSCGRRRERRALPAGGIVRCRGRHAAPWAAAAPRRRLRGPAGTPSAERRHHADRRRSRHRGPLHAGRLRPAASLAAAGRGRSADAAFRCHGTLAHGIRWRRGANAGPSACPPHRIVGAPWRKGGADARLGSGRRSATRNGRRVFRR